MDFNQYQKESWKTAIYPNKGGNIYYPALGLGEAGEVQNKIKKIMRDDKNIITDERIGQISAELGDVLWYIAALCSELRISMDDVAVANISKLQKRKEQNKLKGDGDKR